MKTLSTIMAIISNMVIAAYFLKTFLMSLNPNHQSWTLNAHAISIFGVFWLTTILVRLSVDIEEEERKSNNKK